MAGKHVLTVCPQHSWTVRVPAKVFLAHPKELELLPEVPVAGESGEWLGQRKLVALVLPPG